MNSFFYIEIAEIQNLKFEKKIISSIHENLREVVSFDFDNLSDSITIDYAIKLLKDSGKAFILIDAKENTAIGGVLKFVGELINFPASNIKVVYLGFNNIIEKMIKQVPSAEKRENDTDLFEEVRVFYDK